jgi:heme exporter protein A
VTLEAQGLACSRGFSTLFRGVSLALAPGEAIALRGANGSGKTTLLRCIAGLTLPDAGEVRWAGSAIAAARAAYHAHLIYAGHLAGLKDDLSAEENLAALLALRAVQRGPGAVREALRAVALERQRALPARRLSAGQRRRIGLARLMLDPAPLWILDEPLTALDDAGAQLFAQLLERHLAAGGIALMATHHRLASGVREMTLGP